MDAIQEILSNPAYQEYLAILKGARNGFVYGAKVRFPHALVMSILFGRGELVKPFLPLYFPHLTHFTYSQLENTHKSDFPGDKTTLLQPCQVRDNL
jgi:hypothetical protein